MNSADQTSGTWTGDELREQLRGQCSVKAGDVLIVHSSMKSLGRVDGGPAAVVRALQEAVGEEGTLLMPVFTAPQPDGVFHHAATPSRTGLITETLRTAAGTLRSRHPTHSVAAWGRRAAEFVKGHDHTSGLGVGSPFHKAAQAGADVLMIGCTLTSCSLVHVSEAIARTPYLGKVCYGGYDTTLTLVDAAGTRTEVPPRDVPTDSAGFTIVQDELDLRGRLTRCQLGSAACLKFPAAEALAIAVAFLRADPAALLCRNPRCPVCPKAREIVAAAAGGTERKE
jgi:aminoglycoside 3-N-acetyltransferase